MTLSSKTFRTIGMYITVIFILIFALPALIFGIFFRICLLRSFSAGYRLGDSIVDYLKEQAKGG